MKKAVFILLFVYISACSEQKPFEKTLTIRDDFFTGTVTLKKIDNMYQYKLTVSDSSTGKSDCIHSQHEFFQLETGDMNHDGKTDICVGIIKPTPLDPVERKRLFLFQVDRDHIRPLWLSSRLAGPLEKFAVCKDKEGKDLIRTVEKQGNDLFCIREYTWGTFGMVFSRNIAISLDHTNAIHLLTQTH